MTTLKSIDSLTLDELAAAVKRVRSAVLRSAGKEPQKQRATVVLALRKSGIAA